MAFKKVKAEWVYTYGCRMLDVRLKTAWNGMKLRVSENKNSSLLLIDITLYRR